MKHIQKFYRTSQSPIAEETTTFKNFHKKVKAGLSSAPSLKCAHHNETVATVLTDTICQHIKKQNYMLNFYQHVNL